MSGLNDFLMQLQPILLTLAPVVLPILLAWLTTAVRSAFEKLPSNQRATLESIVQTGVAFAEQAVPGTGAQKKAAALSAIHAALAHFKLNVPDSVIEPMLEEAVLLLNIASGSKAAPVKAALPVKSPLIPSNLTGKKDHE